MLFRPPKRTECTPSPDTTVVSSAGAGVLSQLGTTVVPESSCATSGVLVIRQWQGALRLLAHLMPGRLRCASRQVAAQQEGAEGGSQGGPGLLGWVLLGIHIGYVDGRQPRGHDAVEGLGSGAPQVLLGAAEARHHAGAQACHHLCKGVCSRLPRRLVPAMSAAFFLLNENSES